MHNVGPFIDDEKEYYSVRWERDHVLFPLVYAQIRTHFYFALRGTFVPPIFAQCRSYRRGQHERPC